MLIQAKRGLIQKRKMIEQELLENPQIELTFQKVNTTQELLEVEKEDDELTIKELNQISESLENLFLQSPIARETQRKILREVENETKWNECLLGEVKDSILFEERKE